MKVTLFTSQTVGCRLIEGLSDLDVELLVVSYETTEDVYYGYSSPVRYCAEHGIECATPRRINSQLVDRIRELAPDMVLCAYYARILPRELLDLPPLGAFNVHPGRLPEYRGPFPTAWAIVNGEEEFGITLHQMDLGIDTGPIVRQEIYSIGPDETGFQLYSRSQELAARVVLDAFPDLVEGRLSATEQEGTGSYFGTFPSRYQMDWRRPATALRNEIRAHARPFFPAFSFLKNKCILFDEATLLTSPPSAQGGGRILAATSADGLVVSCADGALQMEAFEVVPLNGEQDPWAHLHVGYVFP